MFSGLRKMVTGNSNTPTASEKTPILSKSASKRKFNTYEGFSAKTKEEITKSLPQKELSFTPMKLGFTERKRLRLSLMDARSTPIVNSDSSSHKNSETSISSEDLLTSSEHLFSAHDTIDLSNDMKQTDKDYVRISKQEYEEIKSRVSAIENKLSREFTEVIPRVEPLQQVQNVYEQTLEEVAMLHCPTSDHLARRLSKELKIRPNEDAKIIRSPSARKIGSIRRRSKENIPKIVRHKSWNTSSQSKSQAQVQNADRFYPYIGIPRRAKTNRTSDITPQKIKSTAKNDWDNSVLDSSNNDISNSSQKYHTRKRISLAADYNLDKTIGKLQPRRSLNITFNNSSDIALSDYSMNNTLNSSSKSNNSAQTRLYQNVPVKKPQKPSKQSPVKTQKWRSAAAFFMDKTGELEGQSQTGRPSVNKLRKQNAGAVLAKAKMFESSSDKSSEVNEKPNQVGFARKPRANLLYQGKPQRNIAYVKPKVQSPATNIPIRSDGTHNYVNEATNPYRIDAMQDRDSCRIQRKTTPPIKKALSPPANMIRAQQNITPALKKPLGTCRNLRTPVSIIDHRKTNTPLKAVHISPRRRSPRQKPCN